MDTYDEKRLERNKATGKPLCEFCEGTGNQFYFMYSACLVCNGTGLKPEKQTGGCEHGVDKDEN